LHTYDKEISRYLNSLLRVATTVLQYVIMHENIMHKNKTSNETAARILIPKFRKSTFSHLCYFYVRKISAQSCMVALSLVKTRYYLSRGINRLTVENNKNREREREIKPLSNISNIYIPKTWSKKKKNQTRGWNINLKYMWLWKIRDVL